FALEEKHPDAVAMFSMGCGADQNPLPRRTVELCRGYGDKLAAAVEEVLSGEMRPLAPSLRTAYERITLDYADVPTREQLQQWAAGRVSIRQRWAARLLKQVDAGEPLARSYDAYPVQVWKLGDEQLWITLGGEVVVDYALGFKTLHGEDVWIAGYCNDVMAYIPSLRVLEEDVPPRRSGRWGYEGNTSMMVYGVPAERWADDIEDRIAAAVARLIEQVR
ncbi:MAG: neutral/alkaline non-lysosomal ceramidase N-terminal domain-containing protein, partial [Planctomycetaceae bacterium]